MVLGARNTEVKTHTYTVQIWFEIVTMPPFTEPKYDTCVIASSESQIIEKCLKKELIQRE